jgi:hypothetical protein
MTLIHAFVVTAIKARMLALGSFKQASAAPRAIAKGLAVIEIAPCTDRL